MEISGEYGEKEKSSVFDEVLNQLKNKFGKDKFKQLAEAKNTAQFLFDVYKTPETKIDFEKAADKTTLLLTMAVATKWNNTDVNDLVERRKLTGIMRSIFPVENRGYQRQTDLVHEGVSSEIFILLIANKFPDCWSSVGLP